MGVFEGSGVFVLMYILQQMGVIWLGGNRERLF